MMWAIRRSHGVLTVMLGLLLPLGVTVAWIPIRTSVPNVDLALVLVVVVCAIGALGRRSGVVVAALSSALWFEFFDTAPFERLGIARNPDVETTLVLALVALIMGGLAVRVRSQGLFARAGNESLSTVRGAAALVASGEELVRIIESVVSDLTQTLSLAACRFEAGEPDRGEAWVDRTGRVRVPMLLGELPDPSATLAVNLLVVAQGETIGRFVLEFAGRQVSGPDKLLVAVTLADTVGGAFLAQAPPPIPPDRWPSLPLRLLQGDPASSPVAAPERSHGRGQETSGLSCAAGSVRP